MRRDDVIRNFQEIGVELVALEGGVAEGAVRVCVCVVCVMCVTGVCAFVRCCGLVLLCVVCVSHPDRQIL